MNKNTHWVPGIKTKKLSNKVPSNYIVINNIPPLQQLIDNIKRNINKTLPNELIDTKKPLVNNDNIEPVNTYIKIPNTISNNSDDREILYDIEGIPINISHELNPLQHKQVITLLKKFIHLFTSDASNIKPANMKPSEIKMKQNYKDPKFHAPHRVSPQQRDELKTQLDK